MRKKSARRKKKKTTPWRRIRGIQGHSGMIATFCFGIVLGAFFALIPSSPQSTLGGVQTQTRLTLKRSFGWRYFRPRWEEASIFAFMQGSACQPDELKPELLEVLSDPKKKLQGNFRVPRGLVDEVAFWMSVYGQYSSRYRIVHDRNNLSLVYGVIDLSPVYNQIPPSKTRERLISKIQKDVERDLRTLLKAASRSHHLHKKPAKGMQPFITFLETRKALGRSHVLGKTLRTQTGQKEQFELALIRSMKLLPEIESIFKKRGLPIALTRIPFVESSFNPIAYSKVGAQGLWQFTPQTAKEMMKGPDRKRWRDPLVQTDAAARLLRNYRRVLPDWGITVTAYNSGVGRMQRLVRKHKAWEFERLMKRLGNSGLGFAGRNFYAEFLAANLIEGYKERFFTLYGSGYATTSIWKRKPLVSQVICKKAR